MRILTVLTFLILSLFLSGQVIAQSKQMRAEDLLQWDQSERKSASDTTGQGPTPSEKPQPPEGYNSKTTGFRLEGRAGPAMPAVPAGEVASENINTQNLQPSSETAPPSPRQTASPGQSDKEAQKSVSAPNRTTPKTPPSPAQNQPPQITLVYEGENMLELDPNQRNMLKEEINKMLQARYRGKINVFSYAKTQDPDDRKQNRIAIQRAINLRESMLRYGIEARQLNVRAMGNDQVEGNVIHIYLASNR